MRNVLIVDDEAFSRNGIAAIFRKHDPAWHIAAMFSDGMEALEYLQKNIKTIDLIVTDIRMPKFNGLELIAKIRESDTTVPIIIISGYSEFSYARQAIDFGVFRYILKPFLASDFDAVISSVDSFLDLKQDTQTENISTEEMYHFTDLLFSEAVEMDDPRSQLLLEKNTFSSFCPSWFVIMDGNNRYRNRASSIREQIRRYFSSHYHSCGIFLFHQCLYSIVLPLEDYTKEDLFFQLAQLSYSIGDDMGLRFGIFRNEEMTASQSFYCALDALCETFYDQRPKPHFYVETGHCHAPVPLFQKLENTLIRGSLLDARDVIFELMDYISDQKPHYKTLQEWFETLVSTILSSSTGQLLSSLRENEVISNLRHLYKYTCLQDLEDDVFLLLDTLFQKKQENRQMNSQYLVGQIKSYLQDHFTEDVSLNDLSQTFNTSYQTLSNSFKNTTGQTIMDYLTQVRIKEAKHLLLNSDTKIYEIAKLVGYNEPKYFIRRFHELVGVTPKEYRKINR